MIPRPLTARRHVANGSPDAMIPMNSGLYSQRLFLQIVLVTMNLAIDFLRTYFMHFGRSRSRSRGRGADRAGRSRSRGEGTTTDAPLSCHGGACLAGSGRCCAPAMHHGLYEAMGLLEAKT